MGDLLLELLVVLRTAHHLGIHNSCMLLLLLLSPNLLHILLSLLWRHHLHQVHSPGTLLHLGQSSRAVRHDVGRPRVHLWCHVAWVWRLPYLISNLPLLLMFNLFFLYPSQYVLHPVVGLGIRLSGHRYTTLPHHLLWWSDHWPRCMAHLWHLRNRGNGLGGRYDWIGTRRVRQSLR